MTSRRKKIAFRVLLVATFVGLFPISVRLGDPLSTYHFRTGWQYQYPILLVWSDHVEMRWFHDISEISPRPKAADYTYNVTPQREDWVEAKVRGTPAPNGADARWIIHVRQLGPSRQQIQLELMGDGITGLIYEVRGDEVVPLRSRLAGPLSSWSILMVHLVFWSGLWFLVWLAFRLVKRDLQTDSDNL